MFTPFYSAMLGLWQALFGFATSGRLADGSRMPPALRSMIITHYTIVAALVARGRATATTNVAEHARISSLLLQEQSTLRSLLNRFGLLSVVSSATTPLWTTLRRSLTNLEQIDPELGGLIRQNLPALPTTPELGLELGVAAAAVVGVILFSKGIL